MEIMKNLNKHILNFDLTWIYVEDQLNGTNTLSSEILNIIKLKEGCFFTLLPDDADLKEIYNFKCGGILPQYPEEENIINGVKSTFSWIPNIRKEIAHLILTIFSMNQDVSCLIDCVLSSPKDEYYQLYSDNYSYFLDDEVYFILSKNNFSSENLLKCLDESESFWHSLCVLTKANLSEEKIILSKAKIKEICSFTELAMVGAYDGEGYVFWEKNSKNKNNSFFAL